MYCDYYYSIEALLLQRLITECSFKSWNRQYCFDFAETFWQDWTKISLQIIPIQNFISFTTLFFFHFPIHKANSLSNYFFWGGGVVEGIMINPLKARKESDRRWLGQSLPITVSYMAKITFLFSIVPSRSTPFLIFHIRSFQARILYMKGGDVKYKGADIKAIWFNKWYTFSLQTLSYPSKPPQHHCWRRWAWLAHAVQTKGDSSHLTHNPDTQLNGHSCLWQFGSETWSSFPLSSSGPVLFCSHADTFTSFNSKWWAPQESVSGDKVLPLSDEAVLGFLQN